MINKLHIKPYKSINDIESLEAENCTRNYIITINFLDINFNTLNKFNILNKFYILNNNLDFLCGDSGYSINVDLLNKFLNLHPDNYFQRITILLYPFKNDKYLFYCYLTDCLDINSTIYQAHIKDDILYIDYYYEYEYNYEYNKIYKKFKNYISALQLLNKL